MIKIQDNVVRFGKETANKISNYEAEAHDINMFNEIQDFGIQSPIEQLLYYALHCLRRIMCLGDSDPIEINGNHYIIGLSITPQYTIGKYRVDFKVSYYQKDGEEQKEKSVLVECDSQAFHDRSEAERRYEKKRDRDIQKIGYKVFRFTGSEIVKNPYLVAAEIIEYVTGIPKQEIIGTLESF